MDEIRFNSSLTDEERNILMYGTGAERHHIHYVGQHGEGSYDVTFEGQVYDEEDSKRHLMFNGMYDIYRTGEDEEEEE